MRKIEWFMAGLLMALGSMCLIMTAAGEPLQVMEVMQSFLLRFYRLFIFILVIIIGIVIWNRRKK
ncbi:hypothetical protein [Paenibacillus dakarensis]|uniref:hypothetical protein n=1 Tax=Paenibacillus dakarensis TaxID=1527293 RepID=UPI0006D5AA93|nr:hypothetical protein [Paenibacillus dakarensis]